jgi:hypothetical protein
MLTLGLEIVGCALCATKGQEVLIMALANKLSLRTTLICNERRKPAERPVFMGVPSQIDLLGLLTQARVYKQTVMMPCIAEPVSERVLLCVTHDAAADTYEWSLYRYDPKQMLLIWRATNPLLHVICEMIKDKSAVTMVA